MRKNASVCVALSAMIAAVPTSSWAQAAAGPTPPAEDNARSESGLEDIVVTAQRKSENLQDVPIAVVTVSANTLTKAGVTGTDTLRQVAPGLMLTTQQRSAQVFIRGVGSQGTGAGDEAAVPIYIDGVYHPSAWGNVFSFNNIERIEVLKGPQGTLFGRNATGGLIQIITRDPKAGFSAEGSANYGNYDTVEGSAYLTGGSDTLAADFAFYGIHQGNGWGKDLLAGGDVNRKREWSARSKILWRPTDADRITISVDYSKNTSDTGLIRTPLPGVRATGGFLNPGTIYDSTGNTRTRKGEAKVISKGASARYQRDFGDINLSVLSAVNKEQSAYAFDSDGTPLPITRSTLSERTRTIQNEILLSGTFGQLDVTAGTFIFNGNTLFQLRQTPTSIASLNWFGTRKQETESYAGFADASYRLTDRLKFTAGVRYTSDKRDFTAQDVPLTGYVGPALPNFTTSKEWSRFTYRGVLDFKLSDDVLLYASYNRGFKSGIFNLSTPFNPPVNPETIDAYEVGFKSELVDRTVRLNMAAFRYDYKNVQLAQPVVGGSFITNAAQARVNGLEADLEVAPRIDFGNLSFHSGVTYLDAKYRSFPGAPISVRSPAICTPTPQEAPGARTGGNTTCIGDASGNRMVRTPKLMLNLSADFSVPVGANELGVSANYYHNSGFFWEADNRVKQPAFDQVNAQAYFAFGADKQFRVRVFGKNLTDKQYFNQVSEIAFGDQGVPAPPRTYGVGLDVKF